MGGEPTRRGKLIHLCIAGVLLISFLSGCFYFKEKEIIRFEKGEVQQDKTLKEHDESLFLAKSLLDRNDFEGALKEYQKVLTLSGVTPPGDEALYHMGMILVHYGNPKRDYVKSLAFFRRLVKDYPQSPRIEQARLWIGVLQEVERLNQSIQKCQQTLEETKKVDIEIEEKKREKTK